MSEENNYDKICRVTMMTVAGSKWDLSDNDVAALKHLLTSRAELLEMLNYFWNYVRLIGISDATLANVDSLIAKAEGRA